MKVIVGMSGGVDSSVAAYLLKREGFEVYGTYFRLFKGKEEEASRCCDLNSVVNVGRIIGIPIEVIDVVEEFEKNIVQYFVEAYKCGITPNPCTICNEKIKFGLGFEKALKVFGDALFATGHYAIIDRNEEVHLKKGIDKLKDQSYMLWRLKENSLRKTIFPLGKFTKEQVYGIAEELHLPKRRESEDICFIQGKLVNFLKEHIPQKRGKILDKYRGVLGEHKGAHFYTTGQRSGLGISSSKPLYIIGLDIINNYVFLGERKDCYFKYAEIIDTNFIEQWNYEEIMLKGKVRYRSEENMCILKQEGGRIIVEFLTPQFAITPGQSLVLYKGDTVFGGGVIKQALR
jgi:tRNA-specific 2-thiouridylase